MLKELSRYVLADPYPFVIDLRKCEGMWLRTVDGQEIFDWAGYYGSKLIGHNHRRMYESEYLERLIFAANNKVPNPDFLTRECLDYYRLIHEIAPVCMRNENLEAYVINSGAEAVENMMKYMINLHKKKIGESGRKHMNGRFIYFDQAFHGRTVFALNITQISHDPVITKDFKGLIQGNIQVPFPHYDSSSSEERNLAECCNSLSIIRECLVKYGDEIIGIIVEPVQGAGGHRVALPEFFRELSRLAHEHNVFLGFDEVQTSGGQTGSIFAVDQFDLPYPPQAIATGKKFGNGVVYMLYPMEDSGVLDSTWGGSLADMVRFMQEMKIVFDENLIPGVREKGDMLVAGLMSLAGKYPDMIFNVRGLGLYQGFSFRNPEEKAKFVSFALREEALLVLGAGTQSIRLRPPLDVKTEEIAMLIEMLDRCLDGIIRTS